MMKTAVIEYDRDGDATARVTGFDRTIHDSADDIVCTVFHAVAQWTDRAPEAVVLHLVEKRSEGIRIRYDQQWAVAADWEAIFESLSN